MILDPRILTAGLSQILAPSRVLSRPIDRIAYASDASFYYLVPQAVVQPVSVAEIQALFAFSQEKRIPLTFRAAGTSLSGQSITGGILVDLSKGWNRIQIEQEGRLIRLGPGVIGSHANLALKPYARRIGPDPASIDACMVGGILANNASGMCCGVAENSYHTLHSLVFVLPSGLHLDTADPQAAARLADEDPDLACGLLDFKRRIEADPALSERVRRRYLSKNTTGYSLNAFLDYETPLDILSHLLVGSEGTLAFIAEAGLHTLPDYPLKYTGLLFFPDVQSAGRAILPLRDSGARALEIMDRAALRSIEDLAGAPPEIRTLPEAAAGLLVEYQCVSAEELAAYRRAAAQACRALSLLAEPAFTEDPAQQATLWKLRKGMFPAIGAMRLQGTTVIIEDVAFPLDRLADAITDLQALFRTHGYAEAIIFGHAKDGNLHFVITQSFNDTAAIHRYERFMAELVALVVEKYDGALKAEHGTGRNIAPFVEAEWGAETYAIMSELKELIDPDGLLNPGVIINSDPQAHLRDLKSLPVVEAEVDQCIECGFCESRCPSRRLTLTPRQRIVVRREMARLQESGEQPELLASLVEDYAYDGLDTCAVDGLCATACPVHINTGDLVKRLRAESLSPRAQAAARTVARHFARVEGLLRAGVGVGHAAERIVGVDTIVSATRLGERLLDRRLPKWNPAVPRPAGRLPHTSPDVAQAVYFPSCLSRVMGNPPETDAAGSPAPSLIETMLTVAGRAGFHMWVPPDSPGECCGMPFSSKGYTGAYRETIRRTLDRFWEWSQEGRLPVVIDASSCAYTLRAWEPDLEPADRDRYRRLTLLDPVEFVHDLLLPLLPVEPLPDEVILHPNCAARKLGLEEKLVAVARACAAEVVVPQHLECCGFAGDRGLLFPELTASAVAPEAAEVLARSYDGYYSSNLTCEMGMAMSTGRPYRSFLYLVEKATRRSVMV